MCYTIYVEIVEKVNNPSRTVPFPKNSDLEASMQNVLRLRQIFGLSVDDVLLYKFNYYN